MSARRGVAGSCWVRGGLRVALRLRAARALGLAPVRVDERTGDSDRVAVSAPAALYGRLLTGTVASLAVLSAASIAYYGGGEARSRSWYAAAAAEALASALLVGAAGAGGARRMERLIDFVNEIQTVNTANKIAQLPEESFGERGVRATMATGLALHALSLAVIAHFTQFDPATAVTVTLMYLPNIFRPVIVLHYACMAMMLHSSLEAARLRLEQAVLGLGTGELYDNAAYGRAYAAAGGAARAQLAACALSRALSVREGPLALLLLAAAAARTLYAFYMLLSTMDKLERPGASFFVLLFIGVTVGWIAYESLLVMLLAESWGRVAHTARSLRPLVSAGLMRAAPRGPLAQQLWALQGCLQLGQSRFSPLDVCPFSRSFTIAFLSFFWTAAAVMRQFDLRDVI